MYKKESSSLVTGTERIDDRRDRTSAMESMESTVVTPLTGIKDRIG